MAVKTERERETQFSTAIPGQAGNPDSCQNFYTGFPLCCSPKLQNFTRSLQDPQYIFPDCLCNPTTYKFRKTAAVNDRALEKHSNSGA